MEKVIGVVGAGTMGTGIALVAAQAGYRALLYDMNPDALAAGLDRMHNSLASGVQKGRFSQEDADALESRLSPAPNLHALVPADVIIEAIVENVQVKREVFRMLDESVTETTILATNTSSLSITAIATACKRPERVVGLHFFNPAPVMKLVEIVRGLETSEKTIERSMDLVKDLGKEPVVCRDTPAFIVNRVARNFYGESLRIYAEGTASIEEIDAALRAQGFKMGAFELMDFIGIDVNYTVTQDVYTAYFQEPRFRPHLLQKQYVDAGRLGRKSGQGFYNYTGGKEVPKIAFGDEQIEMAQTFFTELNAPFFMNKRAIFARVLSMIVNEALFCVQENIASEGDIDLAMRFGTNYPHGVIEWGRRIGFEKIRNVLNALRHEFQDERYRAAPLLSLYQ